MINFQLTIDHYFILPCLAGQELKERPLVKERLRFRIATARPNLIDHRFDRSGA